MQDPVPGQEAGADGSGIIAMGSLRLDPTGFSVTVGGRDLALTLAEFLLLQELASHPFQVLGRQRLSAAIRDHIPAAEPASSSRFVDTHISRLRAKLRNSDYDCIRTMRFVGYRFVPPVDGRTDR